MVGAMDRSASPTVHVMAYLCHCVAVLIRALLH
jgi:hypothetical protein